MDDELDDLSVEECFKLLQKETTRKVLEAVREGKGLNVARQLLKDNNVTDAGIERHLRAIPTNVPDKPFEEPPAEQAG